MVSGTTVIYSDSVRLNNGEKRVIYLFFLFAGIVTNYKEVKTLLMQRGYAFESDTDTEIIAKLIHHLWVQHPTYSFRELVEHVVQQLVSFPPF